MCWCVFVNTGLREDDVDTETVIAVLFRGEHGADDGTPAPQTRRPPAPPAAPRPRRTALDAAEVLPPLLSGAPRAPRRARAPHGQGSAGAATITIRVPMSVRAPSAVLRDVVRCADPWRTAARLERFHCHSPVLLLFDESEDEARRGGYGRTRAAAAARRHLRALRHADGLAAGHRVRVAVPARQGLPDAQELLRQGHGGRQEGQEGQKPTTRSPPPPPSSSSPSPSPSSSRWCRNQAAQDAVDVVHRLDDLHVVHHLDDVHVIDGHDGVTDVDGSGRNKQSCVAGRLGLPALAADARVEGVDAVAASVVAAGPLAGAALSLVLEALLPYPLALLSRARRRASSSAAAAGPT